MSLTNQTFTELLRPPPIKKQLTENQHKIVWDKRSSACNLCGPACVQMNVDHIGPRYIGGQGGNDNMQIICASRHANETMLETLSFVEDERLLLSRFSLETFGAFVDSLKAPQLVASLHARGDGAFSVGVIRCR